MSTAIKNGKIKHFVSSDIKGDVRAIFYKEKSAGTMKNICRTECYSVREENFYGPERRSGAEI